MGIWCFRSEQQIFCGVCDTIFNEWPSAGDTVSDKSCSIFDVSPYTDSRSLFSDLVLPSRELNAREPFRESLLGAPAGIGSAARLFRSTGGQDVQGFVRTRRRDARSLSSGLVPSCRDLNAREPFRESLLGAPAGIGSAVSVSALLRPANWQDVQGFVRTRRARPACLPGLQVFSVGQRLRPDSVQDSQRFANSQIAFYESMRRTNVSRRAADPHIQTNAITISEIAEHAQRVLGLKVGAKKGALEVEDRDGKLKRFFTSFTSGEVKVMGTGGGIGRQSPDKNGPIRVQTQTHLEKIFLDKNKASGSKLGSDEVLAYVGALLMQAVFCGLLVRGDTIGWVPSRFRSDEDTAFLISGPLRLSAAVGRMVAEVSAPNSFRVELLFTERHTVSMRVSVSQQESSASPPSANSSTIKLISEDSREPVCRHSFDTKKQPFQAWSCDWLIR